QGRRYVLRQKTQITADHLPVFDDLIHHVVRHVDGNRESDSNVAAAAAAQDRGVDAYQVAVQIDERAARIARVNRRVCLNEILIILDPADQRIGAAAFRADDAHRRRLADSEWIADREYQVAHFQRRRIAQWQGRQTGRVDLQHRYVGCFVRTN